MARVMTGAAYLPFWLGSTAPLTMRTRHCARGGKREREREREAGVSVSVGILG